MIKNRFILMLLISLLFTLTKVNAQQDTLSREVEVVKSYQPIISPNANKINTSPSIEEKEEHNKPNFEYNIYSNPILNTFAVNPLKPATIETERPTNDGYGLIRVGFGNYNKPYGEIFFNSQQTKNTIFGFHARHLSSHAKIKLSTDDKVKAPYSDSEGQMFVKHLFNDKFISGDLHFKHNGFNYYGLSGDSIPVDYRNSDYFNKKQSFTKGGINLKLGNAVVRADEFNWSLGAKYDYFTTKTDQSEHTGSVSFDISNPLFANKFIMHTGINYTTADLNINNIDSTDVDAWAEIFPSVILGDKIFNAKLGGKLWIHSKDNDDPNIKITPDIKVNFMPIEDKLNIFAGVDGDYHINSYSDIAYFNPYVNEIHTGFDTFEKIRIFGGFSGKLSLKLNFLLSADYSLIDDQTFFIYDAEQYINNTMPNNKFFVSKDDIKRMKFSGEFLYVSSDKLNFKLIGEYYNYELDNLEYAYNMPDWKVGLTANYKFSDRLSISSDINLIGERKVAKYYRYSYMNPNDNEDSVLTHLLEVDLDAIIDINFSLDYKVTPKLRAFTQLNNLAFQRYETWLGYPSQSFNFLAGISYSF